MTAECQANNDSLYSRAGFKKGFVTLNKPYCRQNALSPAAWELAMGLRVSLGFQSFSCPFLPSTGHSMKYPGMTVYGAYAEGSRRHVSSRSEMYFAKSIVPYVSSIQNLLLTGV